MIGEYVTFQLDKCTGCAHCVKACPTRAIRIRKARAVHYPELCIGCGECLRVCPEGVIQSNVESSFPLDKDKTTAAIISPVLYSQFSDTMPCDVLRAVKRMGFDHVVDLSFHLEMFQFAVEQFIAQNRESRRARFPLISPICPVVIRLIALKHPTLLDNIVPIRRPAVMIGEDVRDKLQSMYNITASEIEISHITPCPSKALSQEMLIKDESGSVDRTIGINAVYPDLCKHVEKIREMELDIYDTDPFANIPNARGPMWSKSGGEINPLRDEGLLAVSGLQEVRRCLEKIEMGIFDDMNYIELRVCPQGCLGGPLTAVDRHVAKRAVYKLVRTFGVNRRLSPYKLQRLYERGRFFSNIRPSEFSDYFPDQRPTMTIDQMQEIEDLLALLPGIDCAVCGSPDCRTFAEDVVRGIAKRSDCFKLREIDNSRAHGPQDT
ncbi:MAG: 4Fe-4S binding protein [Desulfobacterales bacterium]|nr:4Fe-4S binding protein [Desulfobacterales bacterium]